MTALMHVAEREIAGALFHIHDHVSDSEVSPKTFQATTVIIGVLVDDPDALFTHAVTAGATVKSPPKDCD
jgi:uncharacterized glyoxalase superfamily protein PhnB